MYATFWALIPPVVAIVLALITKEVYSSLFIGIVVGGLFFSGFHFEGTVTHIIEDGFLTVLSNAENVGILIFLVILGTIVCLINHAGGSAAFGQWAQTHIKSRIGAQLMTVVLGIVIFIDDYFNCLTVGSVMRLVVDKHHISRAKLAYLIDATAAPVCIIAPISSWAAAVTGFVDGEDGLSLFIHAIPYNYYALLTLVFLIGLVLLQIDFGPMAHYETARSSVMTHTSPQKNTMQTGGMIDLLLPILALIVFCIFGMIYTGGFFSGTGFVEAFANSNASVALVLGSAAALLVTLILYQIRRVLPFQECMACLPEGFQAMVPAILILTFAWTLKAMTDSLGAAEYVEMVVKNYASGFHALLPAIIFVIASLLSFATGTAWGTFGILIPIAVAVFQQTDPTLMMISISACMAGAVCGDHCSPISDTTIMASAGAQCEHVVHVSTQMPYAIVVAVISFFNYIIASLIRNAALCLLIGVVLTLLALLILKWRCIVQNRKNMRI